MNVSISLAVRIASVTRRWVRACAARQSPSSASDTARPSSEICRIGQGQRSYNEAIADVYCYKVSTHSHLDEYFPACMRKNLDWVQYGSLVLK